MNSIDTLLWLGSGFSLGSQGQTENQPPLGRSFFSNPRVQRLLRRYRVLHRLWEVGGEPQDLEQFWVGLDRAFNQNARVGREEEKRIQDLLTQSKEDPAHPELGPYYDLYLSGSTPSSRAQAVAGFELKCLLQDLLFVPPPETILLARLWKGLSLPLAIVTFNYDLFVEHTLPRSYSYEPVQDAEAVEIVKLHGSVQWYHNKFCDRQGPCQFCWADGPRPLNIGHEREASRASASYDQTVLRLRDPLMIGLREKREFARDEGAEVIRDHFTGLLRRTNRLLQQAERVLIIGFSFSAADDYLWENLSSEKLGMRKPFVCCHFRESKEYEERVRSFFGTDGRFFRDGFRDEFMDFIQENPSGRPNA